MSNKLFNPPKIEYSQIMICIKFGQLSSQSLLPSLSCRGEIWILNIKNFTQFILTPPRKRKKNDCYLLFLALENQILRGKKCQSTGTI
jgi:hypothetical protein